jgi:hypothetical protein
VSDLYAVMKRSAANRMHPGYEITLNKWLDWWTRVIKIHLITCDLLKDFQKKQINSFVNIYIA